MIRPRLWVKSTRESTRLLLTQGSSEFMRAVLPPPPQQQRDPPPPRAAPTLCEGLSLWLQRPLCVVVAADDEGHSSALGLCDGFGFGATTLHYEVEVIEPGRRRRGLGSFRDLRQLEFRGLR